MKAPAWGPAQAEAYEKERRAQRVIACAPDLDRAGRVLLESLESFDEQMMPAGLVAGIEMMKRAIAKVDEVTA